MVQCVLIRSVMLLPYLVTDSCILVAVVHLCLFRSDSPVAKMILILIAC